MKHFKTLLFAAALFIGATSFSTAQSKIAHINTQKLIEAMPEYISADAEIKKLGKTYEATIQESFKELDNKLKQYNAEAEAQTQEENQKRMEEVEGIKQSLGQYQQQAQKDLEEKRFNLLKPITEKAKAAIEKVAAAQGIEYVLEAGTLIVAKGKDLMPDVKAELGI
ncbi:OmpH family outer membrane protein [Winogradskyella echinorum]|uniref:OmpH family outer membrane protein n=1 Tax=Winogradskyella echinorum TaxID=538189 RepID=A0ABR6Y531_9FLAO|nr:OmpH family outer membrane protein [Winogradskyella echinorum]MBC3847368.1 OmpH family outer membrane protein [Winogradskyella echinorum]MBC5751716.1 OmpH family outer membrane protein [Winogradskyella echinorum]